MCGGEAGKKKKEGVDDGQERDVMVEEVICVEGRTKLVLKVGIKRKGEIRKDFLYSYVLSKTKLSNTEEHEKMLKDK